MRIGTERLVSAGALPPSIDIPAGYNRADPSAVAQAELIRALVDGTPWREVGYGRLVESLLALGRTDVVTARLCEGHVDAERILGQAGTAPRRGALYGVWASRSHATGVSGARVGDAVRLDGTIRFASGAGVIDRALVPVWLDAGTHLLADLAIDGLAAAEPGWASNAMRASHSHTLTVAGVEVSVDDIVGDEGFYLGRPGFFPGGVGVAAVWLGGAARVVDLCLAQVRSAPVSPTRVARLGRMRVDLSVAASALRQSAARIDELLSGSTTVPVGELQAISTETRGGVADAVERILAHARVVAGAAGFAFDAALSQAIHDLDLYVLQRNQDADAGWLGEGLVGADE